MISVNVNQSVAAALNAQATAEGLSIEAYRNRVLPAAAPRLSPDELDRLLDEEATNGPSPIGSFSRAELHSDHD